MSIATAEPMAKTINKKNKGGNRYRFQGFADRISLVDIDISRRIQRIEIEPGENSSFFIEAFNRWQELDLSGSMVTFVREVHTYVRSLPLLLYHKKDVVRILLHHLAIPESSSRAALLDLLSTLARDLRQEFYPFFGDIMPVLVSLINPESPEELERVFSAFAYLFKFLIKNLLRDVEDVFTTHYHTLLAHPKDYVRRFAGETFAFLMRKLAPERFESALKLVTSFKPKDAAEAIAECGNKTSANAGNDGAKHMERFRDGLGCLLFFVAKGIQQTFYSKIEWIYPLYLDVLASTDEDTGETRLHRQMLMIAAQRRMANHSRKEHCTEVWKHLVTRVNERLQQWKALDSQKVPTGKKAAGVHTNKLISKSQEICCLLTILDLWVKHRKGSRIQDKMKVIECLRNIFDKDVLLSPRHCDAYVPSALSVFISLWQVPGHSPSVFQQFDQLLPSILSLPATNLPLIRTLVKELRDYPPFLNSAKPLIYTYAQSLLSSPSQSNSGIPLELLCLLVELVGDYQLGSTATDFDKEAYSYPSSIASESWNKLPDAAFISQSEAARKKQTSLLVPKILEMLQNFCDHPAEHLVKADSESAISDAVFPDFPRLSAIWASLHLLPRVSDTNDTASAMEVSPAITRVSASVANLLSGESTNGDSKLWSAISMIGSQATTSLLQMIRQARQIKAKHSLELNQGPISTLFSQESWDTLVQSIQKHASDIGHLRSMAAYLQELKYHRSSLPTQELVKPIKGKKKSKKKESAPASEKSEVSVASFASDVLSLSTLVDTLLPALSGNLASPTTAVRRLTASILAVFPAINYRVTQENTKSELRGECDALQIIDKTFRLAPTIANEKSISQGVTRLQVMATSTRLPPAYAEPICYFLIGVFRIKFSPVWKTCKASLAAIASMHGSVLWPIYSSALERSNKLTRVAIPITEEDVADGADSNAKAGRQEVEGPDDGEESVDNSSHVWTPITAATAAEGSLCGSFSSWCYEDERTTDNHTFSELLMGTITTEQGMTTLANKHGQSLADMFEGFLREFDVLVPQPETNHQAQYRVVTSKKNAKAKLQLWLKLLAKTLSRQTVAKITQADFFKERYIRYLTMSEPEIQASSLDCLIRYELPYLNPYKERLHRLIDEKTFRNEMTVFHLDPRSGLITDDHREGLAPLLIRVLFPKIVKRKTTKTKSTLASRRAAILSFLGGLEPSELSHLVAIIVFPFQSVLERALPAGAVSAASQADIIQLVLDLEDFDARDIVRPDETAGQKEGVPTTKQIGLLKVLQVVLSQLRSLMGPYLKHLCSLILYMFRNANNMLGADGQIIHAADNEDLSEDDEEDDEDEESKIAANGKLSGLQKKMDGDFRSVRQLCLQRFAAILNLYPRTMGGNLRSCVDIFLEIADDMISKMSVEGTQHRGGLINVMVAFSEHIELLPILLDNHQTLIPALFQIVAAKKVAKPVVHAILDFAGHLLNHEEEAHLALAPKTEAISLLNSAPKIESSDDEMESEEEGDEGEDEGEDEGDDTQESDEDVTVAAEDINSGDEDDSGWVALPNKEVVDRLGVLWKEHVPLFLSCMHNYLESVLSGPSDTDMLGLDGRIIEKKPMVSNFPKRELEIISRLSRHANDSDTAHKLVDLLLPCLASASANKRSNAPGDKHARSTALSSILKIVRDMVPLLDDPERVASFLARQFMVLKEVQDRSILGEIFVELGKRVDWLASVAPILMDLTSMEAGRINTIDYDRRVDAYSKIKQELVKEWNCRQMTPVVYAMIADLSNEEMGLRTSASHTLITIISHLQSTSADSGVPEDLIKSIIYPALKSGLKNNSDEVRREVVRILSHLVGQYSVFYQDLAVLTHENPDLDFFHNIVHIQLHRRRKALVRLRSTCESGVVTAQISSQILIPLIQHFIYEPQSEQSLLEEAIKTVGQLCGLLSWNAYYSKIVGLIKQIWVKPSLEKILVRLMCNIVDNFQFDLSLPAHLEKRLADEAHKHEEENVNSAPAEEAHESDDEDMKDEGEEPVDSDVSLKMKIRDAISTKLIPQLREFISERGTKKQEKERAQEAALQMNDPTADESQKGTLLRVPVAMALVKLLKKLPQDIVVIQFPRLLTVLVGHLNSRNQTARDVTRSTLVSILDTMGPSYFWFMLTELKQALTRGFQMHVLGYVVHSMLVSLSNADLEVGAIDYCVDLLMEILMEDLLGEVAREKQVDKIRNSMREAHKSRAPDALELVSRMITFKPCIEKVLGPIKSALMESDDLGVVQTIAEVLGRVTYGLNLNPSVHIDHLLIFLHNIVVEASPGGALLLGDDASETGEKENGESKLSKKERARRMRVTKEETMTVQKMPSKSSALTRRNNANTLIVFALQLLHTSFRKNRLNVNEQIILAMLDPFVGLITKACLNIGIDKVKAGKKNKAQSTSQAVISISLRCMCYLLRSPLPSINDQVPELAHFVFKLLQDGDPLLLHACFNVLAVIIRHCPSFELTPQQIQLLLGFAEQDMSHTSKQATAFTLLKAILSRKFLLPGVYDTMKKVSELLVQSPNLNVQQQCAAVFLQFLMDYPLGEKRLQQHLGFLLNNLKYPYPEARQVLIELLNTVVLKFPVEVIDDNAEFFFLPLILQVVNDQSAKCRTMIASLLKLLIGKVSPGKKASLIKFALKWYSHPSNFKMQQVAVQMIGFSVEALGTGFSKHLPAFMQLLEKSLTTHLPQNAQDEEEDVEEEGQENDDSQAVGTWKVSYYSLMTLEKLLVVIAGPTVAALQKQPRLWEFVQEYSLHPHSWVRQVTARIVGSYLATLKPSSFQDDAFVDTTLLGSPDALFILARIATKQLQSRHLNDRQAQQVVKNLLFLGLSFHASPYYLGAAGQEAVEVPDEGDEGDEGDARLQGNDGAGSKNRGLNWLFKRMSYMSRAGDDTLRESVFRWFAAMVSKVQPANDLEPYLIAMINPLFRAANQQGQGQISKFSQEVLDILQARMGTDVFLPVYSQVRERVAKIREERRIARKTLPVSNPEAAASRKISRNENKKRRKKRVIEEKKGMLPSKKAKTVASFSAMGGAKALDLTHQAENDLEEAPQPKRRKKTKLNPSLSGDIKMNGDGLSSSSISSSTPAAAKVSEADRKAAKVLAARKKNFQLKKMKKGGTGKFKMRHNPKKDTFK